VKGVRVSQIEVTSGARGKLFDSDIITEVVNPRPRRAVRTTGELQAALSDMKAGDVITLGVYNVQQKTIRVESIRIGGSR
jgi:PDZ domain-containing secreted protein